MNLNNISRDVKFNFATVALNVAVLWSALASGEGWIADWLSLAIFPTLATFNKVSFSSGVFFNKSGDELTHKLPKHFGKWLTMTIGVTGFALFIKEISFSGGSIAFFITVLSMYFMLSTCPISIISSSDAWRHKKVVFGMVPAPVQNVDNVTARLRRNSRSNPLQDWKLNNRWHMFK